MSEQDPSKQVYSEEQAASVLGISKRMLAERRRSGKIGHLKDGHFIGYLQRHLDAYCAEHDTAPPPENLLPRYKSGRKAIAADKLGTHRTKSKVRRLTPEELERAFSARKPPKRLFDLRRSLILVNPYDDESDDKSADVKE